ncbi:hypothetical protein F5878DRAFT_155662 [Lentinula raphanica]|uniref:Uncharacterized protein n=1 Tax=Lentinula raphanica TaxID=153919 RepID=A0AA38PK75_9AGAR|nr:hypothetical protein F5878DRAFT_155662 [Lentinula raphanica]
MRFSIAYPAFAILALLSTVTSMPTPDVDRATRNQRLTQDSIAYIKEQKAQDPSLRITIGFKPPPLYSYPTPKASRDAETRVKDDLEHLFGSTHDFVFDPDLKYPFSIVYKTIQYTLSLEGSETLAEFQVASSRTTPKKGDQPIVVVVMSPVDDKEHHRWPDSNDCEEQEQLLLGLASPIRSGMQREQ